jgi:polysaccharide export outer membrane protein
VGQQFTRAHKEEECAVLVTCGVSVNFHFFMHSLNERCAGCAPLRRFFQRGRILHVCALVFITGGALSFPDNHLNAKTLGGTCARQQELVKTPQSPEDRVAKLPSNLESTEDWNRHLRERSASTDPMPSLTPPEYTIGPEDVLEVNVFEAQEMNREVRVSATGEISLPLLGAVRAAGLTPRKLETTLEELLRQQYMKDPHVGVFVKDMQSHPVSVMGAVRKPGTFQIRGNKTLLEILSLSEGLADDAGEDVIILRGAAQNNSAKSILGKSSDVPEPPVATQESAGPGAAGTATEKTGATSQNVLQVNLKDLLDSTDPRHNPTVYPGDIVKVSRAGIVYVVGAVQRPGGFAMKTNEKISVLQAIALSEGLTRTAAKGSARIIRTNEQSGARTETPIDLGKILSGKSSDPMLGPRDIVFVPDSAAKTVFSRGAEAATQTLAGLLIFHW